MPNLYHYVEDFTIASISKNGLLIPKVREEYSDTAEINYYLNDYRPQELPDFIDRDRCIFFWSHLRESSFMLNRSYIQVDSSILEPSRVFGFRYEYAHAIWKNTVDAPYSGITSPYSTMDASKRYWNSCIPLHEIAQDDLKFYEILYFGEVLPGNF